MFKRKLIVAIALVFCFCFMSSLIAMAQQEEAAATVEKRVKNVSGAVQEESVSATVPSVEPATEPVAEPVTQAPKEEAVAKPAEASTQWLWGEVVSVDQEKKELVVKHMDYESYEDVNTTIKIDESTMFENIANLSEIKAGDRVTLDYKVKDGSNMAELVVIEKEEPAAKAETVPAPATEVSAPPAVEPTAPVVGESTTPQTSEPVPQAVPTIEAPQTPLATPEVQATQ